MGDLGQPKAELAAARLGAANPFISVVPHPEQFDPASAERLVAGYDLVLACTDNLPAKFLANEICQRLGKPLIAASIHRFDGELLTVLPSNPAGCLACLWPETPAGEGIASCAESGVLGAIPALLGTMQALEAIKLLLGQPVASAEALLLVDGLSLQTTHIVRHRNAACPVCGSRALAAE
jgi:adenylyltransferase/sulfurtransferase